MAEEPTTRALVELLQINRTFAWEVLRGDKGLSDANLVKAWRLKGWKLGKLKDVSDEYANQFADLHERAA